MKKEYQSKIMNAIDKIIKNMPKNLGVNTQIRYIYLELAKIFKKDIAFSMVQMKKNKKYMIVRWI